MDEKCKQGQPWIKWKERVQRNMIRIGLRKEDAAD